MRRLENEVWCFLSRAGLEGCAATLEEEKRAGGKRSDDRDEQLAGGVRCPHEAPLEVGQRQLAVVQLVEQVREPARDRMELGDRTALRDRRVRRDRDMLSDGRSLCGGSRSLHLGLRHIVRGMCL